MSHIFYIPLPLDLIILTEFSEEFGLSNYMSWEVAEIVGICERRKFIKPTVYQGIYNLLDRTPEGELFPCLRKFGIKFIPYSTLAGGYLTGKHLPVASESASAGEDHKYGHFSSTWSYASFYTSRYPPMAAAVTKLQAVAKKHDLSLAEVSYRWLQWHSKMIPEDHGIILGATKLEQFESALIARWVIQLVDVIVKLSLYFSEKGPLPDEVVEACEKTWLDVRGVAKNYWLEDFTRATSQVTN